MARGGRVNAGARVTKRATKIVEYVVQYVERTGRFEGRGRDRRLVLSDVIDLEKGTGLPLSEPRHAVDDMVTHVVAFLARPTRRRSTAPSKSRTSASRPTATEA